MASILKISIRNRLLLISLATIFLLSVQSGLIFDAQSKLQWLDDKGIEHLNREDKMLLDIYEFNYTIASYIQLEYRSYLYTLLSHDQHEPSTYELDYIIEEINTFYHNLLERENIGTNITTYETQQNSNYTALQNFAKNFENIYNLSDFNEELEVFKTVVSDIARRDAADYRTVLGERINSTKEFGQQSSMMHHMYGTNMFNSGKAVEDGFNYLENNDSLLLSSINEKNNFTIKYELINQYYAIKNDITSLINEWTYNQLGWSGNSSQGHDVIIDSLNLFLDSLNQRNETITNNLILFRNHQNLTTTEVNYVLDILNSFLNLIIPNLQNSITNQIGLITIEMQIENTIETDFNVLGQTVKRLLDQTLINIRSDRDKFLRILSEVKALLIEELNTLTVQSVLWIISLIVFTLIPTVLILRSRINKLLTKTQTISEGDLNIKIASKYGSDEFGRIEKIFDEMVLELRNFMITARRTSNTLSGIAEELAAGSEEASASIRDVANTMREFSLGASEQNLMLSRVNEKLITHINEIERAALRIGEASLFVLKVAKRTNILGLNASIEAAKAGNFGLGFNVVAEEVRGLSDDTRSSAREISDLIKDVEYNIKNTVQQILDEVGIVREVAENTAAGSEEANASANEQVTMLGEISTTSSQLSELSNQLNIILQKYQIN